MFSDEIIAGYDKLIMVTGWTDLRCGVRGLTNYLDTYFGVNVYDEPGTVYLFCGRSARKIKALTYSKDVGVLLLNIELESKRVRWIRKDFELREISETEFHQILNGERL